jgi:hypothetical protein
VDLVVRATRTGFTHVLVVKTAAAAADAAVREIRFNLGGDARVQRLPDGSLQAIGSGQLVARGAVPMMWDSGPPRAGTSARGTGARAGQDDSGPAGPGDGARMAELTTEVTAAGDLVLRPDRALLGPDAHFPVFIDPEWSTGKSRWAYATDNNSNNTDVSRARVGRDPNSGKIYRSFFEFPTSAIKGKHVESAYVQMELDHSWSCTNTWTHLFHSGAISTPRTAWKTPLVSRLVAAESRGNEDDGCHDSPQPDMTVNFIGGTVTSLMNTVATRGVSNITFGLSAGNETGQYEDAENRWKKFYPDRAKLIATVDAKPGKPYGLQVNGVACGSANVLIGVANPYFSAMLPDADGTTQTLTATWEFVKVVTGTVTKLTGPPKTSTTANTRSTSSRVSAPGQAGVVYGFRVQSRDPAPFDIDSPLSDYCYFTVDGTRPSVRVDPVTLPPGPGKAGTFKLSSPDDDVVRFQYGWTEAATSSVAATVVAGEAGRSAAISATAPKYGQNVLYVKAIDATNNTGDGSFGFTVDRPAPPVAHWGLETYPGADQAAALADRQTALSGNTLPGDTPLTASNAGWTDDVRVLGGRSATFAGSTQLTTTGPVVDTTRSFSVAAWVRPAEVPSTGDWGVVTQDSALTLGFGLGTRLVGSPLTPRWSFAMKDTAAQTSSTRAAYSEGALTAADASRWTHLAGVYDKEAGEIRLYVNGTLAAQQPRTVAPWNAAGSFGIGRYSGSGVGSNWFRGNIVDVQVYNRVLVSEDFTGQLADAEGSGGFDEPGMLTPIQVAAWDFETAVPCYEAGVPDTCEAPDTGTGWQRRLALAQGTGLGPGYRSQGVTFDDVHFIEDETDPHFGEATQEWGIPQRNLAPAGQPPQWATGPVLRTDQAFTVSMWLQPTQLDQTMNVLTQTGPLRPVLHMGLVATTTAAGEVETRFEVTTETARGPAFRLTTVEALEPDTIAHWYHLVYVHDPGHSVSQRLYVNGELAAQGSNTHLHSGGHLTIGSGWRGAVDEVSFYQGAMTSSQVALLHRQPATS